MEEELKIIKSKIRKVKKYCETWIKCADNYKTREIYIKINSMLNEIVRN